MAKRLELTERIKSLIAKAVGDDVDFTKIAAYEAVSASTRPISQSYSPYDGAQMTQAFLQEMADYLETESVPKLVMHEGHMLPIGKVFHADVLASENGHFDLNSLFFVQSQSEYAEKIDLGIIDEVSVGALPNHAYCSECDFDYAAPGNEMSFYYRECDNEHMLGVDGVHLRLTGLKKWKEQSLVGKGASNKPKILGSAKQRLSKEAYQQLAADGMSPEAIEMAYLLCSATQKTNDEGDPMDLKALTDQVVNLSSEKTKAETKLELAETNLLTANASVESLTARVTELEASLEAASNGEDKTKLEEVNVKLAEAKTVSDFVAKQANLACVAAGIELKESATVIEQIAALEEAQVKLANIPRGGVALGAGGVEDELVLSSRASEARNSAFVSTR